MDQVENDIDRLEQVISNSDAPRLIYSDELSDNLFNYGTDKGRLVLVDEISWAPAPYDEIRGGRIYPSASVKTGLQWVIVALQFAEDCTPGWSPAFGPTPGLYMYSSPTAGNCYAFARINYNAGATTCRECRIVLDGVVESAIATDETSSGLVIPDPLVENSNQHDPRSTVLYESFELVASPELGKLGRLYPGDDLSCISG